MPLPPRASAAAASGPLARSRRLARGHGPARGDRPRVETVPDRPGPWRSGRPGPVCPHVRPHRGPAYPPGDREV